MKENLIDKQRETEKDFINKTNKLQDKINKLQEDIKESQNSNSSQLKKSLYLEKPPSNNIKKNNKNVKNINSKLDLIFKEPQEKENLIMELNKMKEN